MSSCDGGSIPSLGAMKKEVLRAEDYKVLWQCSYYDGVLSGVLKLHKGKELYYFKCFIDECVEDQEDESVFHYRVFAIHNLSDEEKEILIARNDLWKKHSGNGSDWDCRWDPEKKYGLMIDWDAYNKEKENIKEFPELSNESVFAYTTDDEIYRSRVLNKQVKR